MTVANRTRAPNNVQTYTSRSAYRLVRARPTPWTAVMPSNRAGATGQLGMAAAGQIRLAAVRSSVARRLPWPKRVPVTETTDDSTALLVEELRQLLIKDWIDGVNLLPSETGNRVQVQTVGVSLRCLAHC
jgi:hypothetical protein